MIGNYFKIAIRTIRKHPLYAMVNVIGLSVGMACFIVILTFVRTELSFDRFHRNQDRLYRLQRIQQVHGETGESAAVPAPLLPALTREFPEITDFVRLETLNKTPLSYQDRSFIEDQFLLADPAFFQAFSFPLEQGDAETVLRDKYSVVITEQTAERYFGSADPLGKTLTLDSRIDLTVTGVARDIPYNTDIRFALVAPFSLILEITGYDYLASWGAYNFQAYVLTQPQFSLLEFEQKSVQFCQTHRPNQNPEFQLLKSLSLESISAIHLNPNLKLSILIFTGIGIVILTLACINFMNLAIAQSASRIKEVGMRKVIGASRPQIMAQFFGESIMLALIALPLALLLVELVFPVYNQLFNLHLNIDYFQNWPCTLGLLGIAMLVGLISGLYPSWYVSARHPAIILRTSPGRTTSRSGFRNLLVVFQFTASILLVIITLIIHSQLRFIAHKDLGTQNEHVITIPLHGDLSSQSDLLKTTLLTSPDILQVSGNHFMTTHWNNSIQWEGMRENDEMMMRFFMADADFVPMFRIDQLAGRNFRADSPADIGRAYLLNEAAVKALNWESTEAAVGKRFRVLSGLYPDWGRVVGVLEDFHYESLRNTLQPLAIVLWNSFDALSIRVRPENTQSALNFTKKALRDLDPHVPFEYYFLEDEIGRMYKLETQLGQIFSHFSMMSILIACLGLLGLTSYSVVSRTKEIGIRKVFGASVPRIVTLLSTEFTRWVVLANLIAWPVAYLLMRQWLQQYAYHVHLHWWMFALSGIIALTLALLTVGTQVISAALRNPAESLRYE